MKTSIVIPVFRLTGLRLRNFKFVFEKILESSVDYVIVAEQTGGEAPTLSWVESDPRVKHLVCPFLHKKNIFLKAALVNMACLVLSEDCDFLWVHDADVYIPFDKVLEAIPEGVHIVKPFTYLAKLNETESAEIIEKKRIKVMGAIKRIVSFGAASFIVRRKSFFALRGFNEGFRGWGYEDMEVARRFLSLFTPKEICVKGVHLYHEPSHDEEECEENLKLFQKAVWHQTDGFVRYVKEMKSVIPFDPEGFEKIISGREFGVRKSERSDVSVVVVCHEPYLKYLPECLMSIDEQRLPPFERVLVLDNCSAPEWVSEFRDWRVVHGNYGCPNSARNRGLTETNAPWIVWIDSDDRIPPEYLEEMVECIRYSEEDVAIVFPDIIYFDDEWRPLRKTNFPESGFWALRDLNYAPSYAAWKRKAILEAGAWPPVECYEDWILAMNVTRKGWKSQKVYGTAYHNREHSGHRWQVNHLVGEGQMKWGHLHYAIVTALSGLSDRERFFDDWKNWLLNAEIPPNTELVVADNGCSADFSLRVLSFLVEVTKRRLMSIRYVPVRYKPDPEFMGDEWERQAHVSSVYNSVLPDLRGDLVLILEDDVLPPMDGFRSLVNEFPLVSTVGAVGGVYAARNVPGGIVGSTSFDYWKTVPRITDLPEEKFEVGFVGAGFTLYRGSALHKCLPCFVGKLQGVNTGWDGMLSQRMRENGYTLWLDGRIRCLHQRQEVF